MHVPPAFCSPAYPRGRCGSLATQLTPVVPNPSAALPRRNVRASSRCGSLSSSLTMAFQTRAFKTIFCLYTIYVICWLPYALVVPILKDATTPQWYFVERALLCLGYVNSAVNPLVYVWRIRRYRQACRGVLFLCHSPVALECRRIEYCVSFRNRRCREVGCCAIFAPREEGSGVRKPPTVLYEYRHENSSSSVFVS